MATGEASLDKLTELLLVARIERDVSEKLAAVARDLGSLTQGMSEEDAGRSRHMLLDMMQEATAEFFAKAKERLNKKGH